MYLLEGRVWSKQHPGGVCSSCLVQAEHTKKSSFPLRCYPTTRVGGWDPIRNQGAPKSSQMDRNESLGRIILKYDELFSLFVESL